MTARRLGIRKLFGRTKNSKKPKKHPKKTQKKPKIKPKKNPKKNPKKKPKKNPKKTQTNLCFVSYFSTCFFSRNSKIFEVVRSSPYFQGSSVSPRQAQGHLNRAKISSRSKVMTKLLSYRVFFGRFLEKKHVEILKQ